MPIRTSSGAPCGVRQGGRRGGDHQAGLYGPLRVVLMRFRIAEIGQHPVTHIFGDETAGLLDLVGAAAMIDAKDVVHVLRIQLRRKFGRTDQIAEHDRQLATLCGQRHRLEARAARDGFQQPFAMAGRNPQLLEVGVGQPGQGLAVQAAFKKDGVIL